VPDDVVVKDNQPYTADGGSFPSGHTNTGYTDALLMAEMIPERFDALGRAARAMAIPASCSAYYPLDVMGSRMVAQRNVAHYLNDANTARCLTKPAISCAPRWKKSADTLAECEDRRKDDPYRDPAMTFYRFTMTYDLPQQKGERQSLKVPEGGVLLEAALQTSAQPSASADGENRAAWLSALRHNAGSAVLAASEPAAYALGHSYFDPRAR
jgi:hypothetical protein